MRILSRSQAETESLAARIAAALSGGETLALIGPLGAGKTCFVRGLARGLAIDARRVRSPSFTTHHRYEGGRLVLDHFDAYFVREAAEFDRDGLAESLEQGHVIVVEWADRFRDAIGTAHLTVQLAVAGEEQRALELSGPLIERIDLASAADEGPGPLRPGDAR